MLSTMKFKMNVLHTIKSMETHQTGFLIKGGDQTGGKSPVCKCNFKLSLISSFDEINHSEDILK